MTTWKYTVIVLSFAFRAAFTIQVAHRCDVFWLGHFNLICQFSYRSTVNFFKFPYSPISSPILHNAWIVPYKSWKVDMRKSASRQTLRNFCTTHPAYRPHHLSISLPAVFQWNILESQCTEWYLPFSYGFASCKTDRGIQRLTITRNGHVCSSLPLTYFNFLLVNNLLSTLESLLGEKGITNLHGCDSSWICFNLSITAFGTTVLFELSICHVFWSVHY